VDGVDLSSSDSWPNWWAIRRTFSRPVVTRSLAVSLTVGTILNAINQGAEIVHGQPVNMLKLVLTYAVPFFVASFGAYSAFRQANGP
jgi:hypothetical protein